MTEDDLIMHLAVGNLDPELQQPNRGCWWSLVVIVVLTILYVLI